MTQEDPVFRISSLKNTSHKRIEKIASPCVMCHRGRPPLGLHPPADPSAVVDWIKKGPEQDAGSVSTGEHGND